jgi:tRNA (guanine37-N1)-methyltransferase
VIQAPPVYNCYKHVSQTAPDARVVYLSPQGRVFNQDTAREFSKERDIILLCGHYEGIDERVLEEIVTDEVSIGDYILTGGELAALVFIDAVSRLVPGVLGKEQSFEDESFSDGLLEYPHYTRPAEFLGKGIPEVLLSGHHGNVDKWRHEMRVKRTKEKRPDLLSGEGERLEKTDL